MQPVKKYIMVIDEGTTGVRSIIFDKKNDVVAQAYSELTQIYPQAGWCEQDPEEIYGLSVKMCRDAMKQAGVDAKNIAAIGITTQRSTNVLWDKESGKPVYNAITWQDMRTADLCNRLSDVPKMRAIRGLGKVVKCLSSFISPLRRSAAGKLLITASDLKFSPVSALAHTRWVLDNVPGANEKAKAGELLNGTMDTWLVWKLTGGKVHATDYSNASSTNMYDSFALKWSDLFLGVFDIPKNMLPDVRESSGDYGETLPELFGEPIPITGVIADQQAALFAEGCFEKGSVKCTNGTGSFIDMNVGCEPAPALHKLTPLIAWGLDGKITYMLEGYVTTSGSAVQWLRDGLGIIKDASETEAMARSVPDSAGVYVVPAFAGLTAPYWDSRARGTVVGLTRHSRKEHLVRALLEGIAHYCGDIMRSMEDAAEIKINSIKADGGASRNDFLLQFMADVLSVKVERPKMLEATALGAAYLAGLKVGYWTSTDELLKYRRV
ncbi:MAG: glycerol kinase, partial [Thermoplasmata archaeon HGW-Thermoplasmata-1]